VQDAGTVGSYVAPYVLRGLAKRGVPDLPALRRLHGAVVVADISGFTATCERLAQRGPDGVDVLSRALNRYFARLIDVIDRYGGEVVNFAGDALIALWEVDQGDLAAATDRAMACAAELAASPPTGRIPLTARFGVGAGDLCGVELGGTRGRRHCVLSGAALLGASSASRSAGAGHVVLDAGATRPVTGSGSSLETPDRPAAVAVDMLRDYLPAAVLARVARGQRSWLAELRTVTAIFVHIPGFDVVTDLARAHEVVRLSQEHLGRWDIDLLDVSVDDHGTCLVAVTGLPPFAHGDDAARAVDATRALAEAVAGSTDRPVIGIATGRAFCGPVGNDSRATYTVIGDVMNTAARMMQHGVTSGAALLCDAATERAARHRHQFGTSHRLRVKGKRDVLLAYEPDRPHLVPTGRLGHPIVGREQACAALAAALGKSLAGTTRVVLIEGEPGIGKSRLLAELPSIASAAGARPLAGTADHLERSVPYRAWLPIIAALADTAVPADLAPLLNGVLGRDRPETPRTAALRGEQRTEMLRQLLVGMVCTAAARRPLVVALDDAHWLDSASWALTLAVSRMRLPLLVVVAGRLVDQEPVELTALRAAAGTELIKLGPLARPDLVALVSGRLGAPDVPAGLVSSIAERSGGNPLLVEELLFSLREAGVLVVEPGGRVAVEPRALVDLPVPDTVEGVLGSRMNGLSPDADLAIKVASALGQTFDRDTLAAVHPVRTDVDTALGALVRRELIVAAGPGRFVFRHALTRDVAYHRMLTRQRRGLHRRIAGWLETLSANGRVTDHALLGHHWDRAGVRDRASGHLRLASITAVNEGMGTEAVDLGLRAAELLDVPLRQDRDGLTAAIHAARAAVRTAAGTDLVGRLETLPASANQRMTTAIGLLLAIEPAVFMNQQIDLFNLIGLRAMVLTLRYGADEYTPGVIAIYAMLDRGEATRRAETFALTKLARRLAVRTSSPLVAYAGFVHSWFVQHWLRPIGENLHSMSWDARAGFDRGDVMLGCFNTAGYVVLLARAGGSVRTVLAAARRAAALIDGRVTAAAFHCKLEIQVAQALAGRTTQPWSLTDLPGCSVSDVDVDEQRDIAAISGTDLFNQIAYYWSAKARLHVYYRRFDDAVDCAQRAEPLLPSFAGQAEEAELTLWFALGLLGRDQEGDRAKAGALLARLRSWTRDAPDLLGHKALLVEGQLAAVTGETLRARRLWATAAESASRAGYRQHAAFAWELAGRDLSAGTERARALHCLNQAATGYRTLGAYAKVIDVQRAMDELR
jgi:class 3 adenylate cyclase/tetratricopeptide (TPR) repeat protein